MLQQATEKRPVDPQAFYYLADAAERRGHSDVARRALLDYRALEGDDPDGRAAARYATRVADLSMRQGDAADAVDLVSARDRSAGADAPLLVSLAEAQLAGGRPGRRAARRVQQSARARIRSNR